MNMEQNIQPTRIDDITFITPPVSFACAVNRKKLQANITGTIHHPLYYSFLVKFSDGYEDDFTILEDGFIVGEKKESDPYAIAIKEDLHGFAGYVIGNEIYVMRWIVDGNYKNIWVKESIEEDGERIFKVYFKGDYKFEMKREKDKWYSRTSRKINPEAINQKLATAIGDMIDRSHQRK